VTRVVAVDGCSGAGKTSFAAALAETLGRALAAAPPSGPSAAVAVPVVSLDDTYPGWDGLEAAVPRLVGGVLAPLATGVGPARLPRWDWEHGRQAPALEVVPAGARPPWLVVEGAGSGARACAPYLTALVWIEAPARVRHARAMARDGEAYRPHWQRWADQEAAHFAREGTRHRADLVLASTVDGPGRYAVRHDRTALLDSAG
jgi:hypothetical protein